MQAQILERIENHWRSISDFFTYPTNDEEYQQKVRLMEDLLEQDYPDDHPVFMLINLLGEVIDEYEMEHFSEVQQLEKMASDLSPIKLLKYLIQEYDLKQKDLIDIFGSQGYVSDILNERRELNLRHIKALSQKFKIKPQFFLTLNG
ncbi:MAG: transcriptional regulator [SAR324 cluster bacterium]|nr:transcriptional regulator [SAR324 cluster bacterium]